MARIWPVPGWTWTTEAATLSVSLTREVAASLEAAWERGSRVVLMVSPPVAQSLARSFAVLPKAGSLVTIWRT